jgi:hypothetical protein
MLLKKKPPAASVRQAYGRQVMTRRKNEIARDDLKRKHSRRSGAGWLVAGGRRERGLSHGPRSVMSIMSE